MWASIAWRLFWRELSRGELWVIAFALFLAVGSVVSLSGITEGVKSALMQRSAQFNAADKVLRSSQPFDPAVIELAQQSGLNTAQQMQFDSMLFAGDVMQLATIKAVSDSYPLRGSLQLKRSANPATGDDVQPEPGQLYFEARLFDLLNIGVGDTVELGVARFIVAGVIVNEPDAPLSVFGGAPRVIMHLADVAATQIVQPGSRIGYRYLFAGNNAALDSFEQQMNSQLTVHQRWQDMDRESAIGGALERAERFLLLAGLLGIVLAACAAAVAAGRYSQRHTQAVAIIKALGATRAQIRLIYGSHLLLVVLFSLLCGALAGQLAIEAVHWGIGFYFADYRADFSWRPLWLGCLTCFVCALLFAARPMWRLANTAAIEVLKQPAVNLPLDKLQLLFGSLAIWGLMWLFSGELVLSIGLFLLCAAFAGILLAGAALLVRFAKPVAAGQSSARRLALANLRRRLWANSFQLITFSLAIFLALLLYFLRAELIGQWQRQIPPGSPNQFLVNITEQQRTVLQDFAAANNLQLGRYYPVVRGRLTAINDEQLLQEATKEDRTEQRVGVGRELNLTWLSELPDNNQVTAGNWLNTDKAQVSVEEEIAQRLDVKLGDTLAFSIGGQQLSATVSSIRKVDWNSLQPNFYMILSPDLLAEFPATYITAFYLEPERTMLLNQLARLMPTVSVISVDNIINQVNDIIAQVTIALSFILLIICLAAGLVLVAQVQATLEQREQELAILRTLGAQYPFLRNALLLEFTLLGAMAGLFATILAEAMLLIVQQRVFELPFQLHYNLWWMGPVMGMVLVTALGWWQLRRLLQIPGAQLMRKVLQG
ncbi:FtsX-like permease family protein [Rheinheimera sp. YQF-2]|uniref:FtsX-like permease family protein n=1 Tax=Rheinheimera lutimaris TaxID=2740584 RepID=A0A7Y5AP85_9GAMM|nr:FtsX-like permease family protein [Rheinheimera lutimaris]NRQ41993.1 FtsX-like permease family protein [Rheinheimera lutimaris]